MELHERKKLSFRPNTIIFKLPESTRRKQAIFNKGSLFYSHCDLRWEQQKYPGLVENWAVLSQSIKRLFQLFLLHKKA
jgi:hypothetical protein